MMDNHFKFVQSKGILGHSRGTSEFRQVRFQFVGNEVYLRFLDEEGNFLVGFVQMGKTDFARMVIEVMSWEVDNLSDEQKEDLDHSHDERGERYYRRIYQVSCNNGLSEEFSELELRLAIGKFEEYVIEYVAEDAQIILQTYRTKESFNDGLVDDEEMIIRYPFI